MKSSNNSISISSFYSALIFAYLLYDRIVDWWWQVSSVRYVLILSFDKSWKRNEEQVDIRIFAVLFSILSHPLSLSFSFSLYFINFHSFSSLFFISLTFSRETTSSAVRFLMNTPGFPPHSWPAGTSTPGNRIVPAAIITLEPIVAPVNIRKNYDINFFYDFNKNIFICYWRFWSPLWISSLMTVRILEEDKIRLNGRFK